MKSPANEYADRLNMAPISEPNELIEYFKKQVDREALRENLKLTPAQRVEKLERMLREKYADRFPRRGEATPKPLREKPPSYGDAEDPPHDASNDLVEALKKDVDRTLLIENLKLTVPQRMAKFEANMRIIYDLRRDLRRAREHQRSIATQRAVDWKRSLVAIAELEALLEERPKRGGAK